MSYRILVVDDTKFMRKMLSDILKQFGYQVVGEADNGQQAVKQYKELRPDIVTMDITMPEMDGIDAMKEIRRIDPGAIVLICSAMSQQELISDALKAGANGYILKPFKPDRVKEIIQKYAVARIPTPLHAAAGDSMTGPETGTPGENVRDKPVKAEPAGGKSAEAGPAGGKSAEVGPAGGKSAEAGPAGVEPAEEEIAGGLGETLAGEAEELEPETSDASYLEPVLAPLAGAERDGAELTNWDLPAEAQDHPGYALSDFQLNPEEMSLEDLNQLTILMEDADTLEENSDRLKEDADTLEAGAGVPELSDGIRAEALKPERASAPEESGSSGRKSGKSGESAKIINLFRGNESVKNFTSSYMCNWTEEKNGKTASYMVLYTESENDLRIEMTTDNTQKQTVSLTLDGFRQLVSWLEDKIGSSPQIREVSKRADL